MSGWYVQMNGPGPREWYESALANARFMGVDMGSPKRREGGQ